MCSRGQQSLKLPGQEAQNLRASHAQLTLRPRLQPALSRARPPGASAPSPFSAPFPPQPLSLPPTSKQPKVGLLCRDPAGKPLPPASGHRRGRVCPGPHHQGPGEGPPGMVSPLRPLGQEPAALGSSVGKQAAKLATCLRAPGGCPCQPRCAGLPGAGAGRLPGLLGTCLRTGRSRQPLISGRGPPPAACWATSRPKAAGPVRPARRPLAHSQAAETHALCLQIGKQAAGPHADSPQAGPWAGGTCCHRLEEEARALRPAWPPGLTGART